MAGLWRRPSAFSTDSEISLAQTDELITKKDEGQTSAMVAPNVSMSSREKRKRIWTVYFIGFMVSLYSP